MPPFRIEPFELRVPRPEGPAYPALLAALAADGQPPLRWAVVAVEEDTWVIAGARPC